MSANTSPEFSDISVLPSSGFNLLAKGKRNGRWWMLKGLKPSCREQTAYQELLRKEYELLLGLGSYPLVVTAYSLEQVDDLGWCIVMEWIDGCTLADWLKETHTRSERRLVSNLLMEALEYVHSQQTEHRDIKPQNIMILQGGKFLKLIDFGLSDRPDYAILKQPAGTEGYMAPEGPSDIYALGCILEELKLGAITQPVIRRCKSAKPERYGSVGEVRKAMKRNSLIANTVCTILPLSAMIAVIILLATRHTEAAIEDERQATQAVISTVQTRWRQELLEEREKEDSLRQHIRILETEKAETEKHQQQVEKSLEDGKRSMDDFVRKSGITQRLNQAANQGEIALFIYEACMSTENHIDEYILSLSNEITNFEKNQIRSSLEFYLRDHHQSDWEKRKKLLPLN